MSRRKGLSRMMIYSKNGKEVGWDVILPKKADKKDGHRPKNGLLAQCE